MSEMKLYVWNKFAPDWSDGLAFAIAHDYKEAQDKVIESMGYNPCEWGNVTIHELGKPVGYGRHGGG